MDNYVIKFHLKTKTQIIITYKEQYLGYIEKIKPGSFYSQKDNCNI